MFPEPRARRVASDTFFTRSIGGAVVKASAQTRREQEQEDADDRDVIQQILILGKRGDVARWWASGPRVEPERFGHPLSEWERKYIETMSASTLPEAVRMGPPVTPERLTAQQLQEAERLFGRGPTVRQSFSNWENFFYGLHAVSQFGGMLSRTVEHLDHVLEMMSVNDTKNGQRLCNSQEELAQQVSQATKPNLGTTLLHGLKMPEKPKQRWLRPSADGKCRDPKSGERLVAVVLRGACWMNMAKTNPAEPCPDDLYEVPPEAASDWTLRDSCLEPYEIPHPPRSVTPKSK